MTNGLWFVVIFSGVVGIAIPGFWVMALASGNVPEVSEGKQEIWFHIAAEIMTGALLIGGAVATWAAPAETWTALVSCLGLGMLLYTATVSPGYYVDLGERPMVIMFAVIWIGTAAAAGLRIAA